MTGIATLLIYTARIIDFAVNLYVFILFVRIVISWFPAVDPFHPIVIWLRKLTDPPLEWLRRNIPIYIGMFDLTPIILFFGLIIAKRILVVILLSIARSLI